MKKLSTLSALFLWVFYAFSQQAISPITISMPSSMPANMTDWHTMPQPIVVTAQVRAVNGQVPGQIKEARVLFTIKSGDAKICGSYTLQNAPYANFNGPVKTWTGKDVLQLVGQECLLKPGNYQLCVQFFGISNTGTPGIVGEACKPFIVEEPRNTTYNPPQNTTPISNQKFTLEDIKKPTIFRWVGVMPKPKEDVTYRLRVWQLMEGQTATQAMKANAPLLEKEVVNATQAVAANLLTGPCRPPYLCDFIWSVQAVGRENAAGTQPVNYGNSEPTTFSVMGNYQIGIQNLVIQCPKNNVYNFTVNISNPNPSIAIYDKLELVMVNNTVIAPINITGTTPAIGTTIPANGSINVSGSFPYAGSVISLCLKGYIKEQANPTLNTASSYTCDTLQCECNPCEAMGISISKDTATVVSSNSGQVNLTGFISGLNINKVKKITIELVYYNIEQTGEEACAQCASNAEWGNFIKPGSANFAGFSPGILNGVNFGREWTWLSTLQKECGPDNGNGTGTGNPDLLQQKCATCPQYSLPENATVSSEYLKKLEANKIAVPVGNFPGKQNYFNLPIAVPPGSTLDCCSDRIRICIRYTIWDYCCHACDIVKCYTIIRKK